jgi:hypothetical protein
MLRGKLHLAKKLFIAAQRESIRASSHLIIALGVDAHPCYRIGQFEEVGDLANWPEPSAESIRYGQKPGAAPSFTASVRASVYFTPVNISCAFQTRDFGRVEYSLSNMVTMMPPYIKSSLR